jgi:multidrug efflux pump subunit AcrA (membrane-fusion protein)
VRAVSGTDSLDHRATTIRLLERLVGRVMATGEPLLYSAESPPQTPEIAVTVDAYVDQAHVRTLAAIPLRTPGVKDDAPRRTKYQGTLVFEYFDARPLDEGTLQRVDAICRHGASAIRNARQYGSIPLVRFWRRLALPFPSFLKLLLLLLMITAAVAGLLLVESDLPVRGQGALQPANRRHVFAPSDGQVQQLDVGHGDLVSEGDLLLALQSSPLDYEFTRVLGEIQTNEQQMQSVYAARLDANPVDAAERERYAQLSAEEERLRKLLESLRRQKDILAQQRAELQVRSPTDGQVLTWDVDELLETRPVKRGQLLLTVAQLDGPWVLKVRVPDRDIGHVLNAQQSIRTDLDVVFVLATDPSRKFQGRVTRVADITQADEQGRMVVDVDVTFDRDAVPDLRPGAEVTARILCGRRCLGYVWLHDFIDAVRTWLFI